MKTLYCWFILWAILFNMVTSQPITKLTSQLLKQIQTYSDTHHFIILNDSILQQLSQNQQFQQIINENSPLAKFYVNNCSENNIRGCQTNNTMVMVYNKIAIQYSGLKNKLQNYAQWIIKKTQRSAVKITSIQQLEALILEKKHLFCHCKDFGKIADNYAFSGLIKDLSFVNFCQIQNPRLIQQLGLVSGNVTFFSDSIDNRVEYTHQASYQGWKIFVMSNFVPNIPKAYHLTSQRFSRQQKNIDVWLMACDSSFQCESFWEDASQLYKQVKSKNPSLDIRMVLANSQQDLAFTHLYHLHLQRQSLPVLIHLALSNKNSGIHHNTPGKLTKQFRYLSYINAEIFDEFISDCTSGKIQADFYSQPFLKKNGFIGKGGDKLIQKLTAITANQILQNRQQNYILLVTFLKSGCAQCDQFYEDYKKVASFLNEEDVVFSVLDSAKNQINVDIVQNIPQVIFLFKDKNREPKRLRYRYDFNYLLNFVKQNLNSANNVNEKIDKQEFSQQIL